jgi:FG-GAP-like repeat/PASTA domain
MKRLLVTALASATAVVFLGARGAQSSAGSRDVRVLRTHAAAGISADGSLAVVATGCGLREYELYAWNALRRSVVSLARRRERRCYGSSTGEGIWETAIAGHRVAWVAMPVLVDALGTSASAPSFARVKSFATGRFPLSIAIDDLNADGKPEVVTANGMASTISVLRNRGDGSFETKLDYATARGPQSVATGDLNADGKPEVVTANAGTTNTVSVLVNSGDWNFRPTIDYPTGVDPWSIATGDLNGDRRPDLATANSEANSVSLLLNQGDGSFGLRRDYRTGGGPRSIAIDDLNADGRLDLVTANGAPSAGTVSVLLNGGEGSFQRVDYRSGPLGPQSVAIGDLDADGRPDLATANGYLNTVSVLVNSGGGSFRTRHTYRTGDAPWSVAIGDLNGDRKPDLATANSEARSASVLLNRGNGRFQAKIDYDTGADPQSVAIGDLNGDDRLDLVTASLSNSASVLLNRPGLCTVQKVAGQALPAAKRLIARANCRVGKIRRVYSKRVRKGRVISQKPRFGTVLPGGGKVDLVVSRGPRSS